MKKWAKTRSCIKRLFRIIGRYREGAPVGALQGAERGGRAPQMRYHPGRVSARCLEVDDVAHA